MSEEKKIDDDMKVASCPICCEIYNQTTRKKVKCNFCSYTTCVGCFKIYCLNSYTEPNCMSCKKRWARDFLVSFLSKNYINNEYKKHQENMLFEKEIAMIPSTQIYLEYKNIANQYYKKVEEVRKEIEILMENETKMMNLANEYMRKYLNPRSYPVTNKEERKTNTAIRPCPKQDCRGFINNRWNCGVCSSKVCQECHEPKEQEHKCDPNTIENVKLLKKETKPCPKCFSPIFKIVGCDQMWCTICKTAFSWVTGKIVNGQIHNPHYFEYLRTLGREDEEIENRFGNRCDARNINNVAYILNTYHRNKFPQSFFRNINSYLQNLTHIQEVELPRYRNNEDEEMKNIDLRIEYLEGKIERDHMKNKIQRRFKKSMFANNILEILQMYYDVSLDFVNEFMNKINNISSLDIDDFIIKANNLKSYVDENIEKVKGIYGYKCNIMLTYKL
jgi:hypothetical protein